MSINNKPQIVIIDDLITRNNYPLVDILCIEYGEKNVHIFATPKDGIEYIEGNLSQKMIVLLDIMFDGKPRGFEIFDEITSKSSLVCFIVMTGNPEKITFSQYSDLINGHAWYIIQKDRPAKEIMTMIKNAANHLLNRIDGALEEWIVNNSPDDLAKPYLKTRGGKSYSLLDILNEIRQDTPFGRDMVSGLLNLTIDLLARNKEQLNDKN